MKNMTPLKTLNSSVTDDDEKSNETPNSNITATTSPSTHANISASAASDVRIIQNFRLIWLDSNNDAINNDDSINTIKKLREVVNTVNKFTDINECIQSMTNIEDEKVFMIYSGELGQTIVPIVHDVAQINCIYIFCKHKVRHEEWAKDCSKVKGVYTDITSICKALKRAAQDCDHNSVSISFVKIADEISNENLDQLDQSFMYTQILKDILLAIEFEQIHINDFLTYYREQLAGNSAELTKVDKIEKEYHDHQPIWWYTYQCFLYSTLNKALRTMEVALIIKMGFFLRDLHNHIAALHSKQYGGHHHSNSFPVYRGQGLSRADFDRLKMTQGGLISFNNFLSTSLDRAVSFAFAESNQYNPDFIGVLFEITIDPSISSTYFARIDDVSAHQMEEEILFSMHSVFRIGEIKQIDNNNSLYQVDLKLTADDDQQLRTLTECIRKEVVGETGWRRLGQLLIRLSQFDKAEELYNVLLEQTSDEGEKAIYYNNLGHIKDNQGDYEKAIEYYEKALAIWQKTLSPNDPMLATSYGNIGAVYKNMGDYTRALSVLQKALEISQKTLFVNHPSLANSYSNIGSVHDNMGEYSKALSYYEKALEIDQKNLPSNHPLLATSYANIGLGYDKIGEYSKALSFYEKALQIKQKTLPPNHPDLATSYNNIGSVYDNLGEYSKALSFYEKALEIYQKTLSSNHPFLTASYNNIGSVYVSMGEYSKALSFLEKVLEIRQKTHPSNHPSLAASYNNIATVYNNLGEYFKALSFYEKALELKQKTLPPNHSSLATSYGNIGSVYDNMGEYLRALSFYEKALEIDQKTLPPNHPLLAISYNNIGEVYNNMGEYPKALSFYEKSLEIKQKTLPSNHPSLATSYNNIAGVHHRMGEYSKALSYFERAQSILQSSLPSNHPQIKTIQENIEIVKKNCKLTSDE
jgi:tetratricopeptide (TPR) repeat protein